MADSPETPADPKPRGEKEYEDPHYHDDDEVPVDDDGQPLGHRIPSARKPPPTTAAPALR
jgi:hypothetical protein